MLELFPERLYILLPDSSSFKKAPCALFTQSWTFCIQHSLKPCRGRGNFPIETKLKIQGQQQNIASKWNNFPMCFVYYIGFEEDNFLSIFCFQKSLKFHFFSKPILYSKGQASFPQVIFFFLYSAVQQHPQCSQTLIFP